MQIGSLIAYEALRYLTGFEPPRAAGAWVALDLRTGLVPTWQPFPHDMARWLRRRSRLVYRVRATGDRSGP